MNRGNLKTYCLGQAAGLKASQLASGQLDLMIQVACDAVAFEVLCVKTNSKFNVTADTFEYDTRTLLDNFCAVTEGGLYYNQGTVAVPDWKKLDAYTLQAMEEKFPAWRNLDGDVPQRFWQEDDLICVSPTPADSLANGFWLYYAQKAYTMTSDDHFPFYGTAQNPRLSVLDSAIGRHFKWQAQGVLGKNDDYRLLENAFYKECDRVEGKLRRNLAVTTNRKLMMQGPRPRHRGGFGG